MPLSPFCPKDEGPVHGLYFKRFRDIERSMPRASEKTRGRFLHGFLITLVEKIILDSRRQGDEHLVSGRDEFSIFL